MHACMGVSWLPRVLCECWGVHVDSQCPVALTPHGPHQRPFGDRGQCVRAQYGMHEGTSQSAGYVAGGAALLLAAYRAAGFPNMTGALVKDALMAGVVQTDELASKCESGARPRSKSWELSEHRQ